MQAAGTTGTRAAPVSWPRPCSSHQRATPAAASSPNALPPLSTSAVTSCTEASGASRSASRVAGPPPRTSTPPTVPGGGSTTVHPVPAARVGPVAHAHAGDLAHHGGGSGWQVGHQ